MRMTTGKLALATLLIATGGATLSSAQTWDTSGNGLLKGTFYFREVVWLVDSSNTGNLGDAIAAYGNITFDGNGNYTVSNAQVLDAAANSVQNLSVTGTYSISASGFGFMRHPLSSGDSIYGLVSNGIFLA